LHGFADFAIHLSKIDAVGWSFQFRFAAHQADQVRDVIAYKKCGFKKMSSTSCRELVVNDVIKLDFQIRQFKFQAVQVGLKITFPIKDCLE
jgi:hypothetical protein